MHEYKCSLVKIVDGDTIDVCIDLGFKVTLSNERVRLQGINTPESRTKNKEEKVLGLAAKARLKELLPKNFIVKTYKDEKGKFGRVLGIPFVDGVDICQQLIDEGHAREYHGGSKKPWV
jgi:micrococcal nuclease|tara:strand:- start:637 stop:993 length:357 start_codon:yes stop_codon:yes gene_type:complete